MKLYKAFLLLTAMTLTIPVMADNVPTKPLAQNNGEYVPKPPVKEEPPTVECEDGTIYEPRKPIKNLDDTINSVEQFSPLKSGHGWYTFDHIGYKDSAFQGERHVAYFEEEGGVQFYGYDKEGLADLMLLDHKGVSSQEIGLLQAPIRADWHTLDGNGVLFGVQATNLPSSPGDYSTFKQAQPLAITGYAAVATKDEIQIRKYNNATIDKLPTEFEVIYSEPKECSSVDFTISINGNLAKVNLGQRTLMEFPLETTGRMTGILVCYAEHDCESLSSIYTYSHTVNGVDYLAPKMD